MTDPAGHRAPSRPRLPRARPRRRRPPPRPSCSPTSRGRPGSRSESDRSVRRAARTPSVAVAGGLRRARRRRAGHRGRFVLRRVRQRARGGGGRGRRATGDRRGAVAGRRRDPRPDGPALRRGRHGRREPRRPRHQPGGPHLGGRARRPDPGIGRDPRPGDGQPARGRHPSRPGGVPAARPAGPGAIWSRWRRRACHRRSRRHGPSMRTRTTCRPSSRRSSGARTSSTKPAACSRPPAC